MKSIRTLFHSFRLLKEVANASPLRLPLEAVSIIATIIDSVLVRIIAVKLILDAVVAGEFGRAMAILGVGALTELLAQSYNTWMDSLYRKKDNIRIHKYFHENLYRSAVDMELRCYDDPAYFDRFILIANNSDGMAVQCVATVSEFFNVLLTTLLTGGLIITTLAELLWITIPCTLLYILISGKRAAVRGEMTVAQSPYEKKQEYLKRVFFIKPTALDMRSTSLPRLLSEMFSNCQAESLTAFKPYTVKQVLLIALSDIFFYGQTVAELFLLSWRALVVKDISVGDFSMLMTSSQTLMGNLRYIGSIFGELIEQGVFAEKYVGFLAAAKEARESQGSALPTAFETLQVEQVSFSYDIKGKVFSDLSLNIPRGRKIALVGPNGAGKSTLVSLLLNLYSPDEGQIRYNGRKLGEFAPLPYRGQYSLIFQDCRLYPFSVAENLLLRPMDGKSDEKRVWEALERVGLAEKIRRLPSGLDTAVTKEFDQEGVVFSGGEVQRLALARAFLQDMPFFIMDEPTSALDPKQELQINRLFTEELKEKTLILISHRLSTLSGVDYIYLIHNGVIEESGTHEELMEHQGHYARIYHAQADLYRF